jgi:lincosamide nucleotidyltransferase
MHKRELLLRRLEEIGRSLQASGRALALLGLGSVGLQTARLDEFSDLDFFVVARDGAKASFLESLEWLAAAAPIAYAYRNTADGHKVLFADAVFCEFAVFEARELSGIPFAQGRLVWREEGFDETVCVPRRAAAGTPSSTEWLLGEALSSLYVGLCRLGRGEKLAAMRAIQVGAMSHTLELAVTMEQPAPIPPDPFAMERRFEQRFPRLAAELSSFMQGYEGSRASALAILAFLERHFEVNRAMASAIRSVCGEAEDERR